MNLIQRIKRIFKKDKIQLESESNKVIPTKSKYNNIIVTALPKVIYEDTKENNFYKIYVLDTSNDNGPVADEMITVKVSDEEFDFKTDEEGKIEMSVDFPPKWHKILVSFTGDEYSPIFESELLVKDTLRPTGNDNNNTNDKSSERRTSLFAHDMTMYINEETPYFVKLRNYKYEKIPNEKVKITINKETYETTTFEDGFATIDLPKLRPGRYEITSEYEGSDKYDPCKTTSNLTMKVRDIDREVIVKIDHLTMEFKVTKDKIDTLKEFVIRTIKNNKETHEKIRVLDDISFDVYKGERLGILGFNGAGKSTLLKIMSGIYEPTSGSITTYGKIAPLLELGAGFDKNYTGKNNIFLNGALLSIDEKTIREKYDDIVEFSELGDFINYPIKNYSSGMRTKLGFSIATLINPDILIIDEILSVGDIKFKKKSADKINSMMEDGVTVLLVSHSINQIKKICDRCIWLENGKIKMEGEVKEVCDAYIKGAKNDMKKKNK